MCLSQPGYSCVWDRVEFSAAFSGNKVELLLAGSERITSRTSESIRQAREVVWFGHDRQAGVFNKL